MLKLVQAENGRVFIVSFMVICVGVWGFASIYLCSLPEAAFASSGYHTSIVLHANMYIYSFTRWDLTKSLLHHVDQLSTTHSGPVLVQD
jgi:hypothetical protein